MINLAKTFLIDANMNTNFWTNQILLMRPDPIYSLSVTSEFNTNSLNEFNNIRNNGTNYNSTLKQNYIGERNNKNYKPKLNSYPGVGLKELAQNTVCIHSGKKVDTKENSMLSALNIHHIHCNNCVDLKQCQLSQSLRVIKPYLRDITNTTAKNSTTNKFCRSNVEQSSSRLTHLELKCPIIACKYAPKCLHLMHECKLAEHLAYTCPNNLVNCPNRENGCIQKLARERISYHLQHCPCSVVCCTFKWVRKLLPNIELLQKSDTAEFKWIPNPTKESKKFGAVKRNWMKPIPFTHTKSSNNNFGNHDVLGKKKLNHTPQEGEELEWSSSIICSCCTKMNVNHNSLDEAIRQEIYYSPNSGVIKFNESNFRNSINKCNNKILSKDYHDKRVINNHLQNNKIFTETFGSKNADSDKLMLSEFPLDAKQINLYSTKDICPSVRKSLIKNPETTLALDEYLKQRDQITFLRQNPQIIGIRNNVNQNANDEQKKVETLKQARVKQEKKSINDFRHRRSRSLYEHLLAKRAENSIHACRRASLASAYNLNPKNPKNISNCNTKSKGKNDIIQSYSKRTIKSLNPIPSNVITGLLQPINIKFSLPFHHSTLTEGIYCKKDDDKNTCEINHAEQHCMDNQGCIANCNESTKSLLKRNDIQLDEKLLNPMLKTTSSKSYNNCMNDAKKIIDSANCNADNEKTNNNINVTNFTSLYGNIIDFKTNNKNNEINDNSVMFNTNHICNQRENKSNREHQSYHHDKVKQLTINPPFPPSPHSFNTDFKNKSSVTNATLESDEKISNDFLGRQIHSVARYGLYAGKMQEFCCGQCVRRDTFAQHYESVHCEIESYLDDWMIHRCPLALSHHNTLSFNDNYVNANSTSQTTCCNFYVDRLIPCMAQQPGSITFDLSAQSFRFRPTPLILSNPANSIDLKTMQSKVRRTEHKLAAMDTLPWELILSIVKNLEAVDLIQLSLVNHFFHNLIQCYILPLKGCIINVWARSHTGAKGSKWIIAKQKWIMPKTFGKLSGWKFNPVSTSGLIAKHLQSCPLNIINKQETPFQYPVNLANLNPYCSSSVVERPGDWLLNAPSTSKNSGTGLSTSSSYYIPKTLRYMEQLDPSIVNFTNNHNGKVLYHYP